MTPRKILVILSLVVLAANTTALDISTGSSCEQDLEPLMSFNNTDGGHIGEPDYYEDKVCLEAEEISFQKSCDLDQRTMFTTAKRNNSHLSIFKNRYNYEVCSESIDANIISDTSCINGTKVASVARKDNTHAAFPSYTSDPYNQSLCLEPVKPTKVSLKMTGVSSPIYADGSQISSGEELRNPVSYPYIVSDQPIGLVSYGEFLRASRPETDSISLTQSRGSFLIPFTENSYTEIENRENIVNERELLQTIQPSFDGESSEVSTVKAIYDFRKNVESDQVDFPERGTIKLKNRGLNENLNVSIGLNSE